MLRAKPLLLKVHRWVGLIVGLLIITQGLTGTLVAFRHELNRTLHSSAMVVAPPAHPAPMQAILAGARSAYPDRRVTRIDYPVAADEAYLVRLETKSGDIAFAAVEPSTARVLRKGPLAAWPVEFAYQVHTTLLSGETGERVVGFTGLMILFMALTGPFVWWPGVGRMKPALQVNLSSGVYRGGRDLHRLAGLAAAPVLLIIAATGVMMAWQPWLAPVVSLVAPVADLPAPKAAKAPCVGPHTLDEAVAAAVAQKPGQVIKGVRFPGKGKVVAVYLKSLDLANPRATDHVWVDACTAKILRQKSAATEAPGSKFFNSLLFVHTGQWLGIVGRVLVLLAAAIAVGLVVTGYIQWVTRTAKMRRNRAARQAKGA
jgi:uncharacterized iron-regulated membrane protein